MTTDHEFKLLQRSFYEDILNFIPSDIAVFDTDGHYVFLNPLVVKDPDTRNWMIGKTDEEYCVKRGKDMAIADRRKELFQKLMQTKKEVEWEEATIDENGKKEIFLRKMFPVPDEQGAIKMVIGYGLNITERKEIEEQVIRSEKRYRDLFNYSQALICTHDLNGKIITTNPAILHTLQYTEAEMTGKNIKDFIPLQQQPQFEKNYLDVINKNGRSQGVFSVLNKMGKKIYLLYQNYKMEEPGIEPYIIGFSQDVTQRILAEQELMNAKKLSEESAQLKKAFLANMSHEIRTPMNGILGVAALMAKTPLDKEQQNYLGIIQDAANNLLAVVNDILDLEKIEAGKMQLEEIPFNISDRIATIIRSFGFKAEEKGLVMKHHNQLNDNLYVKGDPFRLVQILNNFLSNAVKFTERGHIALTTSIKFNKEEWMAVEFVIEDTGIGIPDDKIKAIFNPFIQASSNTTRKYGGTGLGLSICKNLIEMQGGELWVESRLNEGTLFRFILPYKKYETRLPEDNRQPAINYKTMGKKSILVAEDVELNQFLAKQIMQSWGFDVTIADNGRKALQALQEQDFDLVLMDIQMPEMDGINATQCIRQLADSTKASIPIIALTANALKGDSERYLQAGMNDYLSKPFTEESLFNVIKRNLPSVTKYATATIDTSAALPPAPATEQTPSLYDLSMVRSVSGGDDAFIKKMVQLFIDTVPPGLVDLQGALASQQWQKMGKIAHKLKSTIDSMGISILRDDIRFIETSGKHETDTDTLAPLVERVIAVIEECIVQLKQDFSL
ncbi:MAG: ATP-binding protein [Bacteroidota bacterium]